MYTVELLNESKFAKPVILNWFKQQMLNSFQETELTKEQIEQLSEDSLLKVDYHPINIDEEIFELSKDKHLKKSFTKPRKKKKKKD